VIRAFVVYEQEPDPERFEQHAAGIPFTVHFASVE
jgi:hypothetical protein